MTGSVRYNGTASTGNALRRTGSARLPYGGARCLAGVRDRPGGPSVPQTSAVRWVERVGCPRCALLSGRCATGADLQTRWRPYFDRVAAAAGSRRRLSGVLLWQRLRRRLTHLPHRMGGRVAIPPAMGLRGRGVSGEQAPPARRNGCSGAAFLRAGTAAGGMHKLCLRRRRCGGAVCRWRPALHGERRRWPLAAVAQTAAGALRWTPAYLS